ITEPYRILTSRAEYRLLLRQDNADLRLSEKGFAVGLVSSERLKAMEKKKKLIDEERARLDRTMVPVTEETKKILQDLNSATLPQQGTSLAGILRRPEISYESLLLLPAAHPDLPEEIREQVEIQLKYEGYIKKQQAQVERFKKMEEKKIPQELDYAKVGGLKAEAREKLEQIRPVSIGQAGRIAGVTPADIAVLLIYLEQKRRKDKGE
ncbi:MAG: tRNA uridine-5-carboxymethylaminomethyl(34) synthesis enzyme MnmG, partial [Desulfotomaculaceae bacterium]|nr:tRNA uridine-5-carboxymethylaminomethyl(34) synthesis enzyme MnmG [Desulfotomaculaceae bacterium]